MHGVLNTMIVNVDPAGHTEPPAAAVHGVLYGPGLLQPGPVPYPAPAEDAQ